jgi:hypothetical protein
VVRREDAEHCIRRGLLQQESGEASSGRCVARCRLAEHLIGRHLIQLNADCRGEQVVGDDPGIARRRERQQAVQGALDHGALAIQREHLFGACLPAARPEARAAASGQDDGTELGLAAHRPFMVPDGEAGLSNSLRLQRLLPLRPGRKTVGVPEQSKPDDVAGSGFSRCCAACLACAGPRGCAGAAGTITEWTETAMHLHAR